MVNGDDDAAAVSEPGPQDLTRRATTATPAPEGWSGDGRKAFATMATALVPTASPGVAFHDDWDAPGMRASASGSVSFPDVRVPPDALRDVRAGAFMHPLGANRAAALLARTALAMPPA